MEEENEVIIHLIISDVSHFNLQSVVCQVHPGGQFFFNGIKLAQKMTDMSKVGLFRLQICKDGKGFAQRKM